MFVDAMGTNPPEAVELVSAFLVSPCDHPTPSRAICGADRMDFGAGDLIPPCARFWERKGGVGYPVPQ